MLEIDGLCVARGGRAVLRGVDLTVRPGEVLGLIGSNGAGKTSLTEAVSGLLRPLSGTVRVVGHDIGRNLLGARRHLGVAPQHECLYPTLTPREHLRLYADLANVARRDVPSAVAWVTEQMGLESFVDRRTGELSGGQRRRVQAACAMVTRPDVVLLDEPTVGADPESRARLLEAVRQHATSGAAVLYTTHYLSELGQLDASVALLREGKVALQGRHDEVLEELPGRLRLTTSGVGRAEVLRAVHDVTTQACRRQGGRAYRIVADPLHTDVVEVVGPRVGKLIAPLLLARLTEDRLGDYLSEVELVEPKLDDLLRATR